MIKPNELRIGNLFHSTKRIKGIKMPFGVAKVLTLGLFDLEWLLPGQIPAQVEVWNKSEYSEIEPIPLTPEWLEKFGFVRIERQSETIFANGGFHLVPQADGFLFKVVDQIVNYNIIRYVHTLQNIYFSLCREELTLQATPPTQYPHDK